MLDKDDWFADCETPREAVFQALGAASVCWEQIEKAGVFESTRAKAIGDALISRLSELFDMGLGWE